MHAPLQLKMPIKKKKAVKQKNKAVKQKTQIQTDWFNFSFTVMLYLPSTISIPSFFVILFIYCLCWVSVAVWAFL